MNRRGFLGAILAAGVAPAIVRSGILMPVRAIVLPTAEEVIAVAAGNTLLTPAIVAKEALRILNRKLALWSIPESSIPSSPTGRIVIRKPQRYA